MIPTIKHMAIDFAISSYCQAKRRSCARTNDQTGEKEEWLVPKHMKLETFKNVIKNMKAPLTQIQFCGELGDPMMHPDIEFLINTVCNTLCKSNPHAIKNYNLKDLLL